MKAYDNKWIYRYNYKEGKRENIKKLQKDIKTYIIK